MKKFNLQYDGMGYAAGIGYGRQRVISIISGSIINGQFLDIVLRLLNKTTSKNRKELEDRIKLYKKNTGG